jgi:hypothetical protein
MKTSVISLTLAWASCAVGGVFETSSDYNSLLAKFETAGGSLTKFGNTVMGSDGFQHATWSTPFSTPSGWSFNNFLYFDAGAHSTVYVSGPHGESFSMVVGLGLGGPPGPNGPYTIKAFGEILNATAASGDGHWAFLSTVTQSSTGDLVTGVFGFDTAGRKSLWLGDYMTQVLHISASDLPPGINNDFPSVVGVLGANADGSALFGKMRDGEFFLALGDPSASAVPEPTAIATFACVLACAALRRGTALAALRRRR